MGSVCIIGFDSAWANNTPGAVCALSVGTDGRADFTPPRAAHFDDALAFIEDQPHDVCLVAIDQPTIVPNLTGSRPVDRVAASVVSYIGGGVQPAFRGKTSIFGEDAPFWKFRKELGAQENPVESRTAERGRFLIEVFPALALPALNQAFCERCNGPKYNPAKKGKFQLEKGWKKVTTTLAEHARAVAIDALEAWAQNVGQNHSPRKADQDQLDAVLCALIGYRWRFMPRKESVMIGDLTSGYMIAPINSWMRDRLEKAAARQGVPCN